MDNGPVVPPRVVYSGYRIEAFAGSGKPAKEKTPSNWTGLRNGDFGYPGCLTIDQTTKNLYLTEETTNSVRLIDPVNDTVTTIAPKHAFSVPIGVMVTPSSDALFVCDYGNHAVVRVDLTTEQATVIVDTSNTSQPEPSIQLFDPTDIVFDRFNPHIFYVSDYFRHCVRRFDTRDKSHGTVGGVAWSQRERVLGKGLTFTNPTALAMDKNGNLYVADYGRQRIQMVDLKSDKVSTFAGIRSTRGHVDGHVSRGLFHKPISLCFDTEGSLLVSDYNNHCVRKISKCSVDGDWELSTAVGQTETSGLVDGEGGSALLRRPRGLVLDEESGDIYVAEYGNHTVRKIIRVPSARSYEDDYDIACQFSGLSQYRHEWKSSVEDICFELSSTGDKSNPFRSLDSIAPQLASKLLEAGLTGDASIAKMASDDVRELNNLATKFDLAFLSRRCHNQIVAKEIEASSAVTSVSKDPPSDIKDLSEDKRVWAQTGQRLLDSASRHGDVTIIFKSEQPYVKVHRAILAGRSSFFKSLFTSGFRDQSKTEIHPSDASDATFTQLIRLMYTDQVTVDSVDDALELLQAMEFYGVSSRFASRVLGEQLVALLTIDNALPIYKALVGCGDAMDKYKVEVLSFIAKNVKRMFSALRRESDQKSVVDVLLYIVATK